MKRLLIMLFVISMILQSCVVEMNSLGLYKNLKEELPVVVTKKHIRPFYAEGYPQTLIIEYRSINPKYYGQTGKIKTKDAYFYMAVGVGDTLGK